MSSLISDEFRCPVTEVPTAELLTDAMYAEDRVQAVLRLVEGVTGKPPSTCREDWHGAWLAYVAAIPRADDRPFGVWHGPVSPNT